MSANVPMQYLNNKDVMNELWRMYDRTPLPFDAYVNSVDNDEVLLYLTEDIDRTLRVITFEFLAGRLTFQETAEFHGLPRGHR